MKIKLTCGCICDSLTVDGVEEINLSDKERKEVIKKVFEKMEPKDLNELLQWYLMGHCDEYEQSDRPCECCGDYTSIYTLNL